MGDDPLRLRPRIVVAGGGMAGIETSLALADFTGGYAGVTVVDAARRFAVPATAAGTAFGIAPPVDLPLSQVVARTGATLRPSRLVAVDPRRRLAMLAGGELLVYDHLVIAVGGQRVARIPQALTFRGHIDVEALRGLVEGVVLHAERGGSTDLAVVIPPRCAWPLTGYEIALMAREHVVAVGQGARCEVRVLTAEDVPLAAFGPSAGGSVVQALRRAGVEIVTGAAVTSFDWGQIRSADGRVHPADRVVALPEMRGPAIEGLPSNDDGFILLRRRGPRGRRGRGPRGGGRRHLPLQGGWHRLPPGRRGRRRHRTRVGRGGGGPALHRGARQARRQPGGALAGPQGPRALPRPVPGRAGPAPRSGYPLRPSSAR